MGTKISDAFARINIEDRERILGDLRQHLAVPETGGEASLTVVIRGVKYEVHLRATKLQTSDERVVLRAQLDTVLAAAPWRIGEGRCGTATTRKASPWSKHSANCSKPITGAVLYKMYDVVGGKAVDTVSVWFHCPHHALSHAIAPPKIVGLLALSKADIVRYRKQLDEFNTKQTERRRIEALASGVMR